MLWKVPRIVAQVHEASLVFKVSFLRNLKDCLLVPLSDLKSISSARNHVYKAEGSYTLETLFRHVDKSWTIDKLNFLTWKESFNMNLTLVIRYLSSGSMLSNTSWISAPFSPCGFSDWNQISFLCYLLIALLWNWLLIQTNFSEQLHGAKQPMCVDTRLLRSH